MEEVEVVEHLKQVRLLLQQEEEQGEMGQFNNYRITSNLCWWRRWSVNVPVLEELQVDQEVEVRQLDHQLYQELIQGEQAQLTLEEEQEVVLDHHGSGAAGGSGIVIVRQN
jgi:hypothetical protein